jgi:hypothetical protein
MGRLNHRTQLPPAVFSFMPLRWICACLLLFVPVFADASGAHTNPNWMGEAQGPSLTMSDLNDQSETQSSGKENTELPDLIRTLQNAYGNAMKHDTANPDSEATDLLLENAAIRLSSRILSAITSNTCTSNDSETTDSETTDLETTDLEKTDSGDACSLDHESVDLRNLTDNLSYAASQLERVSASAGRSGRSDGAETARVQSLEHLYRMTFVLSKAYLDRSQSQAYLAAAHQQLELARRHIQHEDEKDLCAGTSKGCGVDLLELSELSNRLSLSETPADTQ